MIYIRSFRSKKKGKKSRLSFLSFFRLLTPIYIFLILILIGAFEQIPGSAKEGNCRSSQIPHIFLTRVSMFFSFSICCQGYFFIIGISIVTVSSNPISYHAFDGL